MKCRPIAPAAGLVTLLVVLSLTISIGQCQTSDGGGSFDGTPTVEPPLRRSITPPVARSKAPEAKQDEAQNSSLRGPSGSSLSESTLRQDEKPRAVTTSGGMAKYVDLDTCFVQLIDDVDVPAEESGKLVSIFVKAGDAVEKGTLIAQMDDQNSRRMLEEATLKHTSATRIANDETEVQSAYKKWVLASREHEDIASLAKKGSKSKQEYERSKYTVQISELDLQAAKNKKSLAALESDAEMVRVKQAQDSINRNALKSPVNGAVFEIFKDAGEWLTAGEKVLRIARLDRLRVQGYVEGSEFDPQDVAGRPVTVKLMMARGREVDFNGEIVFVGLEKRGGNRFVVWAEIDNQKESQSGRWILQAGSEVTMRIHMDRDKVNSAVTRQQSSNSKTR